MLSFFIVVLLLVNAAVLVLASIGFFSRWLKWSLPALALAALLHLLIDGFYQPMLPAYAATMALIAVSFYRWKKSEEKPGKGFLLRSWGILWRIICALCLVVSIAFTWYYGKGDTFLSGFFNVSKTNYSRLGWSEAFDEMSSLLEKDYAFGEWKRIDWDSLYEEYAPRIAAAEKVGDEVAYYQALREYLLSLPDGHVSIQGNDFGLRKAAFGGGFGFTSVPLTDGRIVVSVLEEGCPAEKAGLKWGAEIISWNDRPVQTAVDQVSPLWVSISSSPATLESMNYQKTLFLTRVPKGSTVSLSFRNPGESEIKDLKLTAYDDSSYSLSKAYFMGTPQPGNIVDWSILPSGYGYLKITAEIPFPNLINPVGEVRKAVKAFIDAGVPGVVLDLRMNMGGIDDMAMMMMSFFTDESMFYETQAMKNKKTGELYAVGDLTLTPSSPCYTGPVVMLISPYTCSTGEGFPYIMQTLNIGPVLGFYGTEGSFGMASGNVKMPGGYKVKYPNGAALDRDGNIMFDSDYTLQGGVHPDISVPMDMDALKALYLDERDYLLDQAIALLDKK